MVGTYTDPTAGPTVTMVMQYDPADELPTFGIKAVRFTEAEASELSDLLAQALHATGFQGVRDR
jgi:hypothetical protein